MLVLRQQTMRTLTFQTLNRLGYRQIRWNAYQQVNVISVDQSRVDHHLFAARYLAEQLSTSEVQHHHPTPHTGTSSSTPDGTFCMPAYVILNSIQFVPAWWLHRKHTSGRDMPNVSAWVRGGWLRRLELSIWTGHFAGILRDQTGDRRCLYCSPLILPTKGLCLTSLVVIQTIRLLLF